MRMQMHRVYRDIPARNQRRIEEWYMSHFSSSYHRGSVLSDYRCRGSSETARMRPNTPRKPCQWLPFLKIIRLGPTHHFMNINFLQTVSGIFVVQPIAQRYHSVRSHRVIPYLPLFRPTPQRRWGHLEQMFSGSANDIF